MKISFKKLNFGVLIFVFAIVFSFSAKCETLEDIKERGYLKVTTNADFDPFAYQDGDKLTGIDVEIAKKIADSLGCEIKIDDVSFDAIVLELANRRCDFAIAAMNYSEDKANSVDFSEPYYNAKQVIITSCGNDIKCGEDLHGKRIGVALGYTGDIYCTDNFPDSDIQRYDKCSDAVLDLIGGSIDAVVADDVPAAKLVKLYGNKIEILDDYLFEEKYRIAVPKGEKAFLNKINDILWELKSNGELDKIVDKYTSLMETDSMDFISQIYRNLVYKDRYKMIVQGLIVTLEITLVALIIGLIIGFTLSLINVSESSGVLPGILKFIAKTYINIIRGTPLVVQLFVIYYIVFASTNIPKLLVAMIAFGINSGAYVSEVIRGGILSVDIGQYEAGRSLGLSRKVTMWKIVIPQAIKNVLPSLLGEFINLIKETSVAGFIGVTDLSRAGNIIRSQTYEPFVPLMSVAIIYFVIVVVLTMIFSAIERRLRSVDKR